jgi:hypothetical protein
MKTEEQVAALFTLVSRIYLELGVYLSFAEYIRLIVGDQDVEDTLAKCRLDPALQTHVNSYLRALCRKDFSRRRVKSGFCSRILTH